MFKLPHNCTHLTHQQGNVQNSPNQATTVCELRTSRCSSWIQKMQRNQRSNCQHPLVVVQSLSSVQLFVSPWITACQAPLSMGFSRQECWSGLPCPPPADLPDPGIEPRSPALQADSLPTELQGKPHTRRQSLSLQCRYPRVAVIAGCLLNIPPSFLPFQQNHNIKPSSNMPNQNIIFPSHSVVRVSQQEVS